MKQAMKDLAKTVSSFTKFETVLLEWMDRPKEEE